MIAPPPNGWRDAHLHLGAHGQSLSAVDLSTCTSAEDALARIADRAKTTKKTEWITAIGARAEGWSDRRWPTADELHRAAATRPAIIRSFDIHTGVASSAVLALANITRNTPNPAGGTIERDADGNPTGLLIETAWHLIDSVLPAPTHEQLVAHVKRAADDLAQRGFTEAHDMWTDLPLARAIRDLEDANQLPLRIAISPLHKDMHACLADQAFQPTRNISIAGIKIFTDGTLNSRTAHMLCPYADPPQDHPHGVPLMSQKEIITAIKDADAAGLPIIAHAIGDAAVRTTLDAIERADPKTKNQRIEHAQFIDEHDIPRFAKLGVIASMQPCHLLPDTEALQRLTPHRLDRAFPLRDLIDAATNAARNPADLIYLGSDAPVVPPDPADNLQAAVQRKRPNSNPIAPNQAITEQEFRSLSASRP